MQDYVVGFLIALAIYQFLGWCFSTYMVLDKETKWN